MAHHKAALKSIKQTKTQTMRNRFFKSTMRTNIKKVLASMEDKNRTEAAEQMPKTYAIIDKCVSKRIIHKNTAARYKSRLTARLNALPADEPKA